MSHILDESGQTDKRQLKSMLQHYGNSLTSLEYRSNKRACPDWPGHVKVSSPLVLTPQIKHIRINLPCSNVAKPSIHLKILASMPLINSAGSYFCIRFQCNAHEQYLDFCHERGGAWKEFGMQIRHKATV